MPFRFLCRLACAILPILCSAGLFAQNSPQSALSTALENTSAAGLVLDLQTGRQLAVVQAEQVTNTRATPGSILKPLFLNAALQKHEILPQTEVLCRRKLQINDGTRQWNLDCTHPQTGTPFTAQEALAYSCNRYFASLADRIPPAQITAILEQYGLPLASTPETQQQKELLVLGLTGITVSPRQIALAYRKLALQWQQPVRDGLLDSVNYGMAHNAAINGMEIAGKTGTTSHGWFVGASKQLVVVIYLPRGNGADAARLAQHFFLHLATTTDNARTLTIEVFSTQTVKTLTVAPLAIAWKPDGLHLSTGTVQQLSRSGTLRLQANGGPEVRAAGQWHITWKPDGIHVLLTLPSEDYVAAALNGEAAPDEPAASLKAMAIAIRTFALENAGRHRGQGFDLCDSTHCQSLRLGQMRPAVVRAVHETAGETLWFGGQRAHVYYTQHCGGVREAAAGVWPAEQASYLQGQQVDPYCLRRSQAAWQAHIPLTRFSEILRAQGWKAPSPIEDIRIARRSSTGRAEMLAVSGGGAPATFSASSFRFAVDRALGWNQIRSDWYTASVSNGALVLNGKGYGHGVGLCQAGAYEMAVEGHSEKDILSFYFPGTIAGITPADQGWQTIAGAGWTLLTVHPDSALVTEGNTAWAKAQALFGSPEVPIQPIVQDLPTTELFRQTTAEPGWVLASTRGGTIFLQPAAIRKANGGAGELLLHEFLHALVEHQASPETPLWLREGLVETLAGNGKRQGEYTRMPPNLLDSELGHPTSAAASRYAHEVAARMTAALCARYGLTAVRGFLRNGLPAQALRSLQSAVDIAAPPNGASDSLSVSRQ